MAEAATRALPVSGGHAGGSELPGERAVLGRARGENFSVASLLLPRAERAHLIAIYGYARLVDEIGDAGAGDRTAHLDALEAGAAGACSRTAGSRVHPLLVRLAPTVRALALPPGPFLALIEANRQDQLSSAYQSYEELLGYCALSANPVGELVLRVFGVATPERIALSDAVCSALQLAEHWQDVAEDRTNGRVYLPAEDMARFGVAEVDLDGRRTGAALRRLVAFEVERAHTLLDERRAARRHASRRRPGCRGRLRRRRPRRARGHHREGLRRPRRSAPRQPARPPTGDAALLPEGGVNHPPELARAYAHCRLLTRVSGSSFSAGIRLLPADRRDALCAIYALARRIDDIADGELEPSAKLAALAETRRELETLGRSDDDVLVALADAAARFPLPLDAFGDLLDGAEQDVIGEPIETFEELERYARRVAGSIGRLSLGVFDCSDRRLGGELADELGVALQIGNILRDVCEDAANGRVYLPREDLERFGCEIVEGWFEGPLELVLGFEAARGLAWLRRGLELVPLLDRRSASCVLAMAGKYERLLERIEREPERALRGRLSLRTWEKGLVLARSLAGAGSR